MNYNNLFKMQDLFANPNLAGVFPQFDKARPKQGYANYSLAETEKRVQNYLVGVLNGVLTGQGEIQVKGQYKSVLNRVRQLQPLIEGLFNSLPSIQKNLRKNTALYLPYATLGQIAELNTPYKKQQAIKAVLDNLNYNPDFQSANSVQSNSPVSFQKRQAAWKKKTGWK